MTIQDQVSAKDTTSGNGKLSGQLAEDAAARYLVRQGLTVLARNFRCRGGEIDLVCRDRKTLVFVEVRLRRNANYGGAGASITGTKQRRVILAAQHYLLAHAASESDCRFDCILLDGTEETDIEWLRDAFSAD